MARWGTSWTDYAEAVINPAGSTAHIAEDISESIAAAREAQAEAHVKQAEAKAAAAEAKAKAAAAKAAEAQAKAATKAAADEAKATSSTSTPRVARSSTIRSPAGVSLGTLGGSSPTPYFIAGAVLIIGAVYYYSRKR